MKKYEKSQCSNTSHPIPPPFPLPCLVRSVVPLLGEGNVPIATEGTEGEWNGSGTARRLVRALGTAPVYDLIDAIEEQMMTELALPVAGVTNNTHLVAADVSGGTIEVKMGIDAGNSRVCAVGTDGVAYAFPSAISLKAPPISELFYSRQLPADAYHQLGAHEHVISFDDGFTTDFVGELALRQAITLHTARGSNSRYYDGWVKKLVLTAIAAGYSKHARIIIAHICVGVPFNLWTTTMRDNIEQSLKGTHKVVYKGVPLTITVKTVLVKAEGHAAWYTLPDEHREGTVGLLDIGGRTVIGLYIDNGVVQKGRCFVEDLGVELMLDELSGLLPEHGGRALFPAERHDLLIALRKKEAYSIVTGGKVLHIDSFAHRLIARDVEGLLHVAAAKWVIDSIPLLPIVGGGVYFHGRKLREVQPRFSADETNPEFKNAEGYYEMLTQEKAPKSKRKRAA